MRIKLPKDIAKCVEKEQVIQAEIHELSRVSFEVNRDLWVALKKKYKGYDFTGAKIENEAKELVLPFQDEEEDGLDELRQRIKEGDV